MKRELILLLLLQAPVTIAQDRDVESTHYLRSVEIAGDSRVPEVVCIGCSVYIHGIVEGDVVTVGGDIETGGTIQGDAVAVGGRVRLLSGAAVNGDAVAVGGTIVKAGSATIKGDADSFPYFLMPGQRSFHPIGAAVFLAANLLLVLFGAAIFGRNRAANLGAGVIRHPLLVSFIGALLTAGWVCLWFLADYKSLTLRIAAWSGQAIILVFLCCGMLGLIWLIGDICAASRPAPVRWLVGSLVWIAVLMIPLAGALLSLTAMILALGASPVSGLGKDADWLSGCYRKYQRRTKGGRPQCG